MRLPASERSTLLARCTFPARGTRVDLAVSGGPDSCGLALLAHDAGLDATVHHVDHGLRAGSPREADQVARLADRLGFRFVAHVRSVAAGSNLEARARAARRDALPAGSLTGHTMDDQAETVLLNVLRGAGLDGLSGMSDETKPMLELRRDEVRAAVADAGIAVVADSTNFDLSLRRNLLRARVLPELCQVAGRDLVPVLARQAALARADAAYLELAAVAAVPDPCDVAQLVAAPGPLRRRRLRELARGAAENDAHPPSAAEVARLEEVVLGKVVATELSGGRRVQRSKGRLAVEER
jgi:tRNA(Ile)-lysidine synthase